MRLKKEQIQKLAHRVTQALSQSPDVKFKVSADQIDLGIQEIIFKNMNDEELIDAQVKKLMGQYESQIASGQLDRQKVFQMIKKQIVKEKNFIL